MGSRSIKRKGEGEVHGYTFLVQGKKQTARPAKILVF